MRFLNYIIFNLVLISTSLQASECLLKKNFEPKKYKSYALQNLLKDYYNNQKKFSESQIQYTPKEDLIEERFSTESLQECLQLANTQCEIPLGRPSEIVDSKTIQIWFDGERHTENYKCTSQSSQTEKINIANDLLRQHIKANCPLVDDETSRLVNPSKFNDVFKNCTLGGVIIDVIKGCSVPCAKADVATYRNLIKISQELKKNCQIDKFPDEISPFEESRVYNQCQPDSSVEVYNCPISCKNKLSLNTERSKPIDKKHEDRTNYREADNKINSKR